MHGCVLPKAFRNTLFMKRGSEEYKTSRYIISFTEMIVVLVEYLEFHLIFGRMTYGHIVS